MPTTTDVCQRLKRFGYSPTRHIKQYGEELEITLEPFEEGARFVVRVRTENQSDERLLTIPRIVVEAAKHHI